jgi:hypothetical protein
MRTGIIEEVIQMFDKAKVKEICDRLQVLYSENRDLDINLTISVDPLCHEKRMQETLKLANTAALVLPAALDRIEELEQALIETQAELRYIKQFPGFVYLSLESDIFHTMAREQLQQEGIL